MNETVTIIGFCILGISFGYQIAFHLIFPIWVEKKLNLHRMEILIERQEIIKKIEDIQKEIKDFHYQLLEIKREKEGK